MLFRQLKSTTLYAVAEDVTVCINGEDKIDEIYYPIELDHLPVVGTKVVDANCLCIDIVCSNWDKRHELGWIAEP